jgi:DNA-binding Lrp family transcriptional regulator
VIDPIGSDASFAAGMTSGSPAARHPMACIVNIRATLRRGLPEVENIALVTSRPRRASFRLRAVPRPELAMAETRAEPFHVALTALRERLQSGELAPGARAAAVDLADELGLSTTPVREALSRLAGEGLLEDRRGQGYFVRLLGAVDIADLYRMSLAHLLIALEPRRSGRAAAPWRPDTPPDAAAHVPDPVASVEMLFRRWVASTGSRLLFAAFRVVQIQLGPVRRLEAQVLQGLEPEARGLLAGEAVSRGERLAALRQFHAVRIRESARLA